MNRDKSQILCRFNVGVRVVDQEALRGGIIDFRQKQVEDGRIRFVDLYVSG